MVPSCGCCNSGRVYNGHIMVALIETTSELGPRRAARGRRAAAMYPKGGTGIAAGGVGYSGAAAKSRPGVSAGFRAVGAINGLGLPPNALNSNGVNLHEYVGALAAVDQAGELRTGPPSRSRGIGRNGGPAPDGSRNGW